MQFNDDRTDEQKQTHRYAVVAKDRFMSGWGEAQGGASWCAWATETHSDAQTIAAWVRKRPEMRWVRIKHLARFKVPASAVHFHIYVADPVTHPAFKNGDTQ